MAAVTGITPVQGDRRQMPDSVYREVLWRIPEAVVVVRAESASDPGAARIVSANLAALRLNGQTADQIIGRTLREALPQLLHAGYADVAADALRSREPQDLLGHVGGLGRPEESYAAKVFPLPGDCLGIRFEAVSPGEASADPADRLAQTLRASPLAMCILKLTGGELVDANARFLQLFGFDRREEMRGKRAADLGMWRNPQDHAQLAADLRRRGEIREVPLVCRTRSGRVFRALAALELVTVGREECVLMLFWRT